MKSDVIDAPLTTRSPSEILSHLERRDKWYLGGSGRLIWTPPFPDWLERPGFWDEAHYYQYRVAPVYTVTLLDEENSEISCRFAERRWQPDVLEQIYETDAGLQLVERRSLHPADVLTSSIEIQNNGNCARRLRLVMWNVREHKPSAGVEFIDEIATGENALFYRQHTQHRNLPPTRFACGMGVSGTATSTGVHFSQGASLRPNWRHTPFFEAIDGGQLSDGPVPSAFGEDGLAYLGLMVDVSIDPGEKTRMTFGFAAAPDRHRAATGLRDALAEGSGDRSALAGWEQYFSSLPALECSDEFLDRYYYYRWYGLRLFTMPDGDGRYRYPCVAEGLSYFRLPITYSAQCHILETRWMASPAIAQGSLLNFIHNQRDDGSFPGHLYVETEHHESFYHANWSVVRDLHNNHPDESFLRRAYDGLSRYARYFDEHRDPERSGLYDILNMYETGQEYMHRYVAVEEHADRDYWGSHFRLKGVDVTVYLYEIKRLLAWISDRIGDGHAEAWQEGAGRIREAVRSRMWDAEKQMFSDVNPATGDRTGVKAAVCFYPYFTDIVDESHLAGLKRNLLNPDLFWTPFPVPSSSVDDPFFDHEARWKGQRRNCPWNGRVWPMTNSHIAEALATSAIRFNDDSLRQRTAEFITRFVRMMFFDGDARRPNCFEHYNPFTGKACEYRGVDDYQHSWVNELLIKYLAGIRPREHDVIIDPFPFSAEYVRLNAVPVRGRHVSVERTGERVRAWVDDDLAGESRQGTPLHLDI